MKRIVVLTLMLAFLNCNTQEPKEFPKDALDDTFIALDGNPTSLKAILEAHKGKTVFIDIWASWCGDCLRGMPKVKALQKANDDVVFVFLSLDRGQEAWKRGIEKHDVQGEHYYMDKGKKGAFSDFVQIDWIPRYMVVDAKGNIKLFKAVEADDKRIKQTLQ
ncbi:TlpA disulfide reductase family protein [Flavobacteriaceae bacterium SZ-1-7]|uniref:TlpA family protein disulfide reductase n=1 Tax=Tamlana sedimenti TaxID=3134126 RepID=UPI003126578D